MSNGAQGSGLGTGETPNFYNPAFSADSAALGTQHPAPFLSLTPGQLQFLWRVTPSALVSQREDEIPACVTVAQAILESATPKFGWGSSEFFRIADNPFGIKYAHFGAQASGRGTGDNVNTQHPAPKPEDCGAFDAQTGEIENGQKRGIIAQFQRFPNLDEASRAHALLLRAPRYRPAFEVRDDWKQFAERLGPKTSPLDTEHCGYSTNPSYSAEFFKLVNLYRLSDPRALQCWATGKSPG
jgi:flagellum-specific peptidoglycan hydrolase FlgJ